MKQAFKFNCVDQFLIFLCGAEQYSSNINNLLAMFVYSQKLASNFKKKKGKKIVLIFFLKKYSMLVYLTLTIYESQ